jgi:hypothetical protein
MTTLAQQLGAFSGDIACAAEEKDFHKAILKMESGFSILNWERWKLRMSKREFNLGSEQ